MTNTKKTWVSILLAVAIIVGMLVLAAIGGGVFFFYRHVNTQVTSTETAADQFARERARFTGQQPLIEIRDDVPIVRRRTEDQAKRVELEALHVLVYNPQDRRLVRVDVPAWLLKLMSGGGRIRLAGVDLLDDDRNRLTLEDLERHGPGLILDVRDRHGAQVLVWTQ